MIDCWPANKMLLTGSTQRRRVMMRMMTAVAAVRSFSDWSQKVNNEEVLIRLVSKLKSGRRMILTNRFLPNFGTKHEREPHLDLFNFGH